MNGKEKWCLEAPALTSCRGLVANAGPPARREVVAVHVGGVSG